MIKQVNVPIVSKSMDKVIKETKNSFQNLEGGYSISDIYDEILDWAPFDGFTLNDTDEMKQFGIDETKDLLMHCLVIGYEVEKDD